MGNCWGSIEEGENLLDQPVVFEAKRPRNSIDESRENSKSFNKSEKISETSTSKNEAKGKGKVLILQQSCLKIYDFNELKNATGNFHKSNLLGEGGFGPVFMGWVDEHTLSPAKPSSGMTVAVKMLNENGYQGHSQWETEISHLGHLNHDNLVKLIGYCSEDNHRLLVYEYMPQGSLDDHLFGGDPNFQPLSWKCRLKVALGAAKGLAYLHRPDIKVIHRDFKTSNILLDTGFNAKLSDFGLVIDGPPAGKTHLSLSKVFGTYGYVDPTYLVSGRLTTKSDVYGFGVVLLEILSGRHAIDTSRPPEERDLVRWAMPFFRDKRLFLNIVMDNRIYGQYQQKEALKVAQIAGLCVSEDLKLRPSMNEVVFALELFQGDKTSS